MDRSKVGVSELGEPEVDVSEVAGAEPTLEGLHLEAGEPVRWRRQAGGRWHQGTVIQREADGSVAVRDANGAWRSLPVERLEAQMVTPRGAKRWKPLAERAAKEAERHAEEAKRAVAEQTERAAEEAALKLW